MGRGPNLIDAAVPVVVGAVVAVGILVIADGGPEAVALGLAAAAVLWARERAPLTTLAVSGALVLALFAVDREAAAAAVLAPAVALYAVALTRGRIQQIVAALAAVAAVVVFDMKLRTSHTVTAGTLMHIALVAVPLLAAEAWRNHRANVALLLERVELAERTRIARDLHDVMAHTLTTINVQSGVAAHLLDRDPEHARRALTLIQGASRNALDELRAIVGVLRDGDDDGAPLEPAPSVAAVEELVERARAAGLDVSLEIAGERPSELPDAVQLATYRIVQESLTNAARHAPGTAARVGLTFEPDRLVIGVASGTGAGSNGHGAGVGVLGMKERAATVGGTLEAGPVADGFRVDAELPYRRSE